MFKALAAALGKNPEHPGIAQDASAAISNLLAEPLARRELGKETALPVNLCRVFQLHSDNPGVTLAVVRSIVRPGARGERKRERNPHASIHPAPDARKPLMKKMGNH